MDLHPIPPLDPASPPHGLHRRRHHAHLHLRHRLYRRHLPRGLGLRPCGQHLRPQPQRCGLPPRRPDHVPPARYRVGEQRACLYLREPDPRPRRILCLWREAEGEESLYAQGEGWG